VDNGIPYALFANDNNLYYAIDHPNYGNGTNFPDGTYGLTINLRNKDGVGGPFPKNRVAVGTLLATRSLQFTVTTPSNGRDGVMENETLTTQDQILKTQDWLTIFQNPVSEEIVLQLSGQVGEEVSLGLVNLQGQTIQSRSIKLTSPQQYEVLSVRTQNEGMYILKAIKGEKIKTIKVLKVQ